MFAAASILNPNFSYTYVAPERPSYEKLAFAWVNFSQWVISTHCISNAKFRMEPISRGFAESKSKSKRKNIYGKTSASLQSRVAHLAIALSLGGIVLQTPAWIGVALLSSLVVTKIISNCFFIFDKSWTESGYNKAAYKAIPDVTIRGPKGEVACVSTDMKNKEKLEEILRHLQATHQINIRDADGKTMLLEAANHSLISSKISSKRISLILSFHPDIHATCDYLLISQGNALDFAANSGDHKAVQELVDYNYEGDCFSKEEIEKSMKILEEKRTTLPKFYYHPSTYKSPIDFPKTYDILETALAQRNASKP